MTVPMVAVGAGRVLEAALAPDIVASIHDLATPASLVGAASFGQDRAAPTADRR